MRASTPAVVLLVVTGLIAQRPLLMQAQSSTTRFGEIGLRVQDPAVHKKLWVDLLGAESVRVGNVDAIRFPGTLLILRTATPSAGSDGSSLNHFGVLVADIDGTLAKLTAAKIEKVGDLMTRTPRQFTVNFPDSVRVEFTEDTELATPIANHHMHTRTTDPEQVRDWYAKTFSIPQGMRAGKTFTEGSTTGNFPAVAVAGGEVDFAKNDTALAPTTGRAIDHIGFEIQGLNAFVARLIATGATIDQPVHEDPDTHVKTAYVVDPIGVRIALTEGLPLRP